MAAAGTEGTDGGSKWPADGWHPSGSAGAFEQRVPTHACLGRSKGSDWISILSLDSQETIRRDYSDLL